MSNTSFLATVVSLPSAGVAIPARLTIAVPGNAQWKDSEKSTTQTRPKNALIPLFCDESDENRNARNQHETRQKDSYYLTFRLLCLGRFIT